MNQNKFVNLNMISYLKYIVIFSFLASCQEKNNVYLSVKYFDGTYIPMTKILYPNKNDTGIYKTYDYLKSGKIYCISQYRDGKLLHRESYNENGLKWLEKDSVVFEKTIVTKNDSQEISTTIQILNLKEWNKKGYLTFEEKILSDKIYVINRYDSIGKRNSSDTLTW